MTEVVINVFLEAFERAKEVSGSMGLLLVSVCDAWVGAAAIDVAIAGDSDRTMTTNITDDCG